MSRTALAVLATVIFLGAAPLIHKAQAQTQDEQIASTTLPTDATSTEDIASSTPATPKLDPHNPDDVEAYVRSYFADIPVMISIAKCESGFRQYNNSGDPLYGGTGGMVGVFQEAAAIHGDVARSMGLDINTLEGNVAYARYLYQTDGLAPWLASSNCWSPIKSTLSLGSSGSQVLALQQMLNQSGYPLAQSGPGSPGQESTTFGPMTVDAVRRFQCAMRIVCSGSAKSTGYGSVGERTRFALLKLGGSIAYVSRNR